MKAQPSSLPALDDRGARGGPLLGAAAASAVSIPHALGLGLIAFAARSAAALAPAMSLHAAGPRQMRSACADTENGQVTVMRLSLADFDLWAQDHPADALAVMSVQPGADGHPPVGDDHAAIADGAGVGAACVNFVPETGRWETVRRGAKSLISSPLAGHGTIQG